MILKDVTCTCGSTVELLTTIRHPGQIGWNVHCTGTALDPIRRAKLGVALLPRLRRHDPDHKPKPHWMDGIKAAIKQAVESYGHGARRFEVKLDPEALELFRYAN